jgi:hypothetical protein
VSTGLLQPKGDARINATHSRSLKQRIILSGSGGVALGLGAEADIETG